MERREIFDWSQTDKIDRVRHAIAERHSVPYNPANNSQYSKKNLFVSKFQIYLSQMSLFVFTIMMVHALTQNTMKQRVSIADIYVAYVYIYVALQRILRSPHILQVSVSKNIQNMSRTGHCHCL